MTALTALIAAAVVAAVLTLVFVLAFCPTFTRDRPEHPPEPAVRAAQHRVGDDGQRDRPGDDDQWHRLRTQVPHINRRRNAEIRAEEAAAAKPKGQEMISDVRDALTSSVWDGLDGYSAWDTITGHERQTITGHDSGTLPEVSP
jgi:hypothetical protein